MITSGKDVVRRSFECINANDLDAFEQLLDEDFVLHDQDDRHDMRGKRRGVEYFSRYVEAFPGMKIDIIDQVSEGDLVATRWIARGMHEGELLGIKPTNKNVVVHGIEFDRVRSGKIVETWQNWDTLGLFEQLGAMPSEMSAGTH